jgi:hypothetical protein
VGSMRTYDDVEQAALGINLGDEINVEWAADLMETYRGGDVEVAAADLEALLVKLREAAKAWRLLSLARPEVVREAIELVTHRRMSRP